MHKGYNPEPGTAAKSEQMGFALCDCRMETSAPIHQAATSSTSPSNLLLHISSTMAHMGFWLRGWEHSPGDTEQRFFLVQRDYTGPSDVELEVVQD